jgi:uncharacterized membrane protein YoaK (UPF0700 family)
MAPQPDEAVKTWLAVLLAGIGGFVDAVGYVVLFHTFVAHVSGDSIATAVHLGRGEWTDACHRAFPIPLFLLGALLGTTLAELLARRRVRSIFALPFGVQLGLLVLFVILGSPFYRNGGLRPGSAWTFYALAAIPAVAMGLQAALLWRVVGTKVRTTFITGMLVNLVEEVVKYLFWLRDHSHPRRFTFLFRVSPKHPSLRRIGLLSGLWTAYVLGALAGTLAERQWALFSLAIPVGGLAVAICVELTHPVLPPE